jgi:hypothetical protein
LNDNSVFEGGILLVEGKPFTGKWTYTYSWVKDEWEWKNGKKNGKWTYTQLNWIKFEEERENDVIKVRKRIEHE